MRISYLRWLLIAAMVPLAMLWGCGGGGSDGEPYSAPAGTYKFTNEMLSGKDFKVKYDYQSGESSYRFNANGTVNFTIPGVGTGSNGWSINSLGQLIVHNETWTPNSSATTVIPVTNHVGGTMTMTLVNPTAPTYKFTNDMISGKTYTFLASDGFSGTINFNANGTSTATTTNGAATPSWTIIATGQLKLTHSDSSSDVLTPTSSSTTVIPCTDQYTDPANPADNGTTTITLTLVTSSNPPVVYKFTTEMISGKTYIFLSSDGSSDTVTFNANGTTTVSGYSSATPSWIINASGQLKITHSDGSSELLTPTSSSTTVIPCTDQYTDPAHPADNGTSILTLTLV